MPASAAQEGAKPDTGPVTVNEIEKATRVAKYAAEYAERGEFDYDVDPDMQYKNEQSFCNGLIRGGILDAADFME